MLKKYVKSSHDAVASRSNSQDKNQTVIKTPKHQQTNTRSFFKTFLQSVAVGVLCSSIIFFSYAFFIKAPEIQRDSKSPSIGYPEP